MKRHIAALLVLLLVLSAPVGLVWARYTSALSVTGDAPLTLTVTNPKEYTIDKSKMWNALKALSTRPTAIKLCTSNSLPSGLSTPKKFIEASGSGKIGLYTSGTTVYIAPVGGGDAKMYAPEDSSEMFKLDKMGYTDKYKPDENDISILTVLDGLSNLDTSRVTNMNSMFYNCEAVETLDIGGFDTSNVTDMSRMFDFCKAVTALDVSDFQTGKVTDMQYMFSGCNAVTALDVSKFDTANVKNMSGLFSGCRTVTELDVSGFQTDKVTNMRSMFSACNQLDELDVTKFNTAVVEDMTDMFSGCRTLTSLDLSYFNTANVKSMVQMFESCTNLESLDLSSFDTSKVFRFTSMFQLCTSLKSVNLSSFTTTAESPDSSSFLRPSMSTMFNKCENLTELDLSSFDTKNIEDMNNMFWGCKKLKTIYASDKFTTDNLDSTTGSRMFEACDVLTGGAGSTYKKYGTTLNGRSYLYARIDGGSANPGYFTAKNASNAADLTKTLTVDLNGLSNIDAAPVN